MDTVSAKLGKEIGVAYAELNEYLTNTVRIPVTLADSPGREGAYDIVDEMFNLYRQALQQKNNVLAQCIRLHELWVDDNCMDTLAIWATTLPYYRAHAFLEQLYVFDECVRLLFPEDKEQPARLLDAANAFQRLVSVFVKLGTEGAYDYFKDVMTHSYIAVGKTSEFREYYEEYSRAMRSWEDRVNNDGRLEEAWGVLAGALERDGVNEADKVAEHARVIAMYRYYTQRRHLSAALPKPKDHRLRMINLLQQVEGVVEAGVRVYHASREKQD